jgi:hypothetical protein
MTAATTGVLTGAAVVLAVSAAGEAGEFPHVLDRTSLAGTAARLAGLLDPAFLAEAGWDPVTRVLSLPAGHRLLGRTLCRYRAARPQRTAPKPAGCAGAAGPACPGRA